MVGIGNIEKMLKENYYGCHGYLKGTYMIQYDGRCWVEDQEKNGKNLSFKYSKDDIIIIQVNMSTKTLLWTKKVTNESFAINIDTSGELHPCIALAENGASIQLFS